MLIEGKDYKINILILLMEPEIDVTVTTVETLLETLEDGVTISILLNGADSEELRSRFSAVETLRYYESPKNLGVAGGRNFLLDAPECREADIVFVLDNDVITPTDYVSVLSKFLVGHEDAGVVGAVSLDITNCLSSGLMKYRGEEGAFGNRLLKISSEQIKDETLGSFTPAKLFHIGTHPNYYYAYFSARPAVLAGAGRLLRRFGVSINSSPSLAKNKTYVERLRSEGAYEVTTVAGCSQAFRRSLVDELGPLSDLFNPYGFEDVDFCIRAKKAGYKNYIHTDAWLYHGTDSRHENRDPMSVVENDFRCRTILASRILGPRAYKRTMWKQILVSFVMSIVFLRPGAVMGLRASVRGFHRGLNLISGGTDDPRRTDLKKTQVDNKKYVDSIKNIGIREKNRAGLLEYKDRFKGERCFIIGNGPSLNKIDLTRLKGELSFGVNGIFYKYDEMGFAPTFYVVEDNHVIDDNLDRIRAIDFSQKFFPVKYMDLLDKGAGGALFLPVDWGFYWKSHPSYARPRFSKECDRVIYVGQSVTYLNMQLAYYMGFKTVYLVGMDFSYQVPPREEMDGLTFTSKDDDPNHFHKDYFGKGKKWHDPKLENCKVVYEHARKVFEADGRKIYNATVGGELDVFERVDFSDIKSRV